MKLCKRSICMILAILLSLSALSAVAAFLPVFADEGGSTAEEGSNSEANSNIISDNPIVKNAFDQTLTDKHLPKAFTEGSPIGIRLNFGAPFTKVEIAMPTWNDTKTCFTMSLYKWEKDFDTTRSAEPLATQDYQNHRDNSYASFAFNEVPAGEYLICIDNISGGRLGVWTVESRTSNAFIYENGMESDGEWELKVYFSKTPKQAFLPCVSVQNNIDGTHTAPEEYEIPEKSLLNAHKVMPSTWVFTDGLGRESLTYEDVGGIRDAKEIAMFYWTWHGDLGYDQPLNLTEHVKKYPDSQNDYKHSSWPVGGTAYFWNEPIYGYYRTTDTWVLRRQAELLTNAGVDTIFADNTNGNYTWRMSYIPLYETWLNAMQKGAVNVPKISYLFPFSPSSGSVEQIESIYLDIYRPGKYQELWYYRDGKPMIVGFRSSFQSEDSSNLKKEISNFFTWRKGQASYTYKGMDSSYWGWLATYPQASYYYLGSRKIEQMAVGVAVNHNYETNKITAMNGVNVIGRSYSSTYPDRYEKEGDAASKYGYCFSEQFEYALEKDPSVIFITGWNEWTAGRNESWADINNGFPDQFNDEFSRDIEPTKGELKDHYYYQLVNYVRKYKGCEPIPTPSKAKTASLTDGYIAWNNVEPYYAAYIDNIGDRNSSGYGNLVYTETSGRNDLMGARIARDENTVWFYVECKGAISPYTDKLWMNLYIDSDQENQGWETFDYIINKSAASADTLVLEKFTGDGYNTEKVADVKYVVDGRYMVVEVPKSVLGLSGNDYTINFAWTDNVHDEGNYDTFSGDIMDFYISGDVAPGARFKYSYISTEDNFAGISQEEDSSSDGNETTDVTEDNSGTDSEDTQADSTETPASGGCKSVAFGGLFGIVALTSLSIPVLKAYKKKD